jgi:cob(I)alamin adenosyltransferase
MKIYTKTGDDGSTGLFGGARVGKDDLRVDAYGCVDELNAHVGHALAAGAPTPLVDTLRRLQPELFILGAELATPVGREDSLRLERIGAAHIALLEQEIDQNEEKLEPLRTFVMPGGTELAARLHLARTVCRRAERRVVQLGHREPVAPPLVTYLNRLSDLLFVLARRANQLPWLPRH